MGGREKPLFGLMFRKMIEFTICVWSEETLQNMSSTSLKQREKQKFLRVQLTNKKMLWPLRIISNYNLLCKWEIIIKLDSKTYTHISSVFIFMYHSLFVHIWLHIFWVIWQMKHSFDYWMTWVFNNLNCLKYIESLY